MPDDPEARSEPASLPAGEGRGSVLDQARAAADAAGRHAGVTLTETHDMAALREVSALLASVWGTGEEGVPVSSEMMRALGHAGGCTTLARDASGALAGAAVLAPARPGTTAYSVIAAVAPGAADRGIGRAVKLRQRAWALERGIDEISWTFDPLVARNARFNLARLGAVAREYVVGFYGVMHDALNGTDESDRLVASWELASPRTLAAAAGTPDHEPAPAAGAEPLATAPDGGDLARRDPSGLWVRAPRDVVALRRTDPEQAAGWRLAVREVMRPALAEGRVATHMTRDGWYLLAEPPGEGMR